MRFTLNNKPINLKRILLIVVIGVSLIGNIFLGLKYSEIQQELKEVKASLETQKTNEKVLDFTKLFIEKVLKAETEIDFETRIKLENAVRDLKDEEILSQWQKFVDSKTEIEAQAEVKNFLEMLVNKIKISY